VLEHGVLDGDQPTADVLAGLLHSGQHVAVGLGELLGVEAAGGVDLVGAVVAVQEFAGGWDMFQDADLYLLLEGGLQGFVVAGAGALELPRGFGFCSAGHQRIIFNNNIICYRASLAN